MSDANVNANTPSPHPWRWECEETRGTDMGAILDATGKHVCEFGNAEQYYPTEGSPPNNADLALILEAPCVYEAAEALVMAWRKDRDAVFDLAAFLSPFVDAIEKALLTVSTTRASLDAADAARKAKDAERYASYAKPKPVHLASGPKCEWNGCAVVAIAGRTDGGGNAWLLCTDHATAFDGAGYSTVKLAKLAKLAKRDPW